MNQDLIVGLDIGTTKIACLVGRRTENGKIEILGIGKSESIGVSRGVVANIEKTVASIKKAVEEASERSGVDIKVVNVGIAGQHIKSLQYNGMRTRKNSEDEITQYDIDALIEDMYNLAMLPGEEIIHVLPQEYTIDAESGIKEPIGMCGARLQANFHIITGQMTAIRNIYKCVTKAGLKVDEVTLEPLASSAAALSAEEKEAGVALIDIGGGTTDIAIFQDGIIRHTAVIPFGGNIITEDIKQGCTIMRNQAELLKVKFGSALAVENKDTDIVVIPGLKGREPKEISVKNLAHIIEARMTEILEHVHYEIKSSGFEKQLIGGIVITGGGAQLKHMKQLVEYITGLSCRVGYPNEHVASAPSGDMLQPSLSTGVGLVIDGLERMEKNEIRSSNVSRASRIEEEDSLNETTSTEVEEPQVEQPKAKERRISFLQKFKEFFETEED
ncbi:MAG: cell division protein FtsA [Flavobacteriales bacterium]|jgi:cell division protein FtsA